MLGFIATSGATSGTSIALAVSAMGIIADIIVYLKIKGTRMCGMIMPAVASIVYIAMVLCVDMMFFYILAAAIFVIEMAYMDIKRIVGGGVVIMPIFMIKTFMLSKSGEVTPTESGTTIVIMLFIFVSVILMTKIWIAFNKENMEAVTEGALMQKQAADRMANVSENIVSNFDEANGYIKEHSSALDTSNFSMQNIASSVENTAQAIQVQTQLCQDIQNNTQVADISGILTELNNDVEGVTTSINHSVNMASQQNELIEETKSKFDAIDRGVNDLMEVISSFKQVIDDITESAGTIADGITGLSANSEEVAAVSNEGTRLMTKAVDDMGKVNDSLTNIYNLAQDLKSE